MDIKKINELIKGRQWTALLKELPAGKHTIPFPDVDSIKSCKAVAYSLNSDKKGWKYTFNVDKSELSVVISVEEDVE